MGPTCSCFLHAVQPRPELFLRALPQTVPKSQLNFLPCQIKVNLRKPLRVQSECVRSRPGLPLLCVFGSERVGSMLHNYIRNQRFDCTAELVSQRCSTRSCHVMLRPPSRLLFLQGRQPLAGDHSHLQTDGHLHIPHPTADHAGVYVCTATSPVGYASREVQLSVNSKEKVTDGTK